MSPQLTALHLKKYTQPIMSTVIKYISKTQKIIKINLSKVSNRTPYSVRKNSPDKYKKYKLFLNLQYKSKNIKKKIKQNKQNIHELYTVYYKTKKL